MKCIQLSVLSNINKTVIEIKETTGERFDRIETKVSDLESNMKKLVTRDEAGKIKDEVKTEVTVDFEKIVEKKFQERDEISKRESNLIFWGIPESPSDDIEERREHDNHFVTDICRELGIYDPKISQIIRLGKRQPMGPNTKPRGTMVKFSEKSKKREVLKSSSKLKQTDNAEFKNVSISRDLTLQQREHDKKVRNDIKEEFQRRVNNGEIDIELKGRRIVKKKDSASADEEGELADEATALGPF